MKHDDNGQDYPDGPWAEGFEDRSKGFMPHSEFPMSRDYGRDNFPCKQISCISNRNETCVTPARCIIGEDGKCEGFRTS